MTLFSQGRVVSIIGLAMRPHDGLDEGGGMTRQGSFDEFMQMGPVLAASEWPTNAHLVEACVRLGYLREDWVTLDPTYGRGIWWDRWRPDNLITHDIRTVDDVDFRHLPEANDSIDAVVFDPPYVSVGGRETTTIPDLHDRYGLVDAPKTPRGVQDIMNAGLAECYRVVRPGGNVLMKCADYTSSGQFWPGTHHTLTHALTLGFDVVDRLEHIGDPRPQPARSGRQQHARRNLSTLFVFRKPRRARR